MFRVRTLVFSIAIAAMKQSVPRLAHERRGRPVIALAVTSDPAAEDQAGLSVND